MNLASIILLLQLALSLLANPNLDKDSTLKAQANAFAGQAIAIATEALKQPASTPLGITPTSSEVFAPTVTSIINTSDSSTPPIVVTINPPIQQPEPVFGNNGNVPPPPTPIPDPFIANNIFVWGVQTSSSIAFSIDKTNDGIINFHPSVFDKLQVTVHCDLINHPDCVTQSQTFDATNVTDSNNPIVVSGLTSHMGYKFDVMATNNGKIVSRINDFGSGTISN